jgi:fatty-acyl-CoA synthase
VIAGDLLGERARLTPHKTALVFVPTGERFTYRELNALSDAIAGAWLEAGVRKGDRVAMLSESRPEYVAAFFAAGKTGTIFVPLSTRLTAHELTGIVDDCTPRMVMYSTQYAEMAGELRSAVEVTHWVELDGKSRNTRPFDSDAACAPKAGALAAASSLRMTLQKSGLGPEDIYCLLYTSGTTGKPKGVILPHRMIAFNGYNTVCNWQLRDDDVAPIFTPLYHAGGLSVFLTPLFTIGGTIVLHEKFDPKEVWQTIERERCTVIFGVPTIFKMLLDAPEFARARLEHVRWMISGGAPLPAYIIEAYQQRGVTFKQGYGLTEVGVNCFTMTTEESRAKPGSIGKPVLYTAARLVTPSGDDVPDDEVGELWLRGPHVCRGYWNDPEATAVALDADGWFHTGDLARRDPEGFFYIAGRLKDMIISGGVNIYPAELEAVLVQHPAVEDAAVAGVAHETWGEAGIAFVKTRAGAAVSANELLAFLSARLGRYKLPQQIVFVEELPRTPYGKVVKGELRERWRKAQAAAEP